MRKNTTGFTIVELLIVIVVIAILAAISIVAYTGIQQRARDAQRANDIAQIKRALLAYDVVHGGVVRPGSPRYTKPAGEPNYGGWDVSTSASWLVFLRNEHGAMPVDPINEILDPTTANPFLSGNRAYSYYCYNAGAGALAFADSATVVLNYRDESDSLVRDRIRVSSCLLSIPSS